MPGSYVAYTISLVHLLSRTKITQNHFVFLDKEVVRFDVPVADIQGMNIDE